MQKSEPAAKNVPVRHLELKATMLLVFTLALIAGAALFLLRARGFFEPKQHLVLVADNAEGVTAGMDLTFSGFPIGTHGLFWYVMFSHGFVGLAFLLIGMIVLVLSTARARTPTAMWAHICIVIALTQVPYSRPFGHGRMP